jgi:hypothetical protein
MTEYEVTMCKDDGTTPLGQCPKVIVFVDDKSPGILNTYQRVLSEFFKLYPSYQIVSWGRKQDIDVWRNDHD